MSDRPAIPRAARRLAQAFEARTWKKRGCGQDYLVTPTGCHGFCARGPIVVIEPENIFYERVRPDQVPEIIEKTVLGDELIEDLLYVDPETGKKIVHEAEIPFYARQEQIVFQDSGRNFITDIDDYISRGGYSALAKALSRTDPGRNHRRNQAFRSPGPRRRRFSHRDQVGILPQVQGDLKYVMCNADEGDPGAYMDRALLEGNPHQVLEGMIIGAYAIGAREGYHLLSAIEYPMAIKNAIWAIKQAKEYGLAGSRISWAPPSVWKFLSPGAPGPLSAASPPP